MKSDCCLVLWLCFVIVGGVFYYVDEYVFEVGVDGIGVYVRFFGEFV